MREETLLEVAMTYIDEDGGIYKINVDSELILCNEILCRPNDD